MQPRALRALARVGEDFGLRPRLRRALIIRISAKKGHEPAGGQARRRRVFGGFRRFWALKVPIGAA